jgi:hypothetical protein
MNEDEWRLKMIGETTMGTPSARISRARWYVPMFAPKR